MDAIFRGLGPSAENRAPKNYIFTGVLTAEILPKRPSSECQIEGIFLWECLLIENMKKFTSEKGPPIMKTYSNGGC